MYIKKLFSKSLQKAQEYFPIACDYHDFCVRQVFIQVNIIRQNKLQKPTETGI